jgi:hypothetical protein
VLAKLLDELFFVDDDYEPGARRGDNLFAQKCAAQTLDQVQRSERHLVGAIDRQVQALVFGEGRYLDPEPTRLRGRALRSRDADHPQPISNPSSQALHDKGGSRSGPESDHHAVVDLLDRAQRRGAFQLITIGRIH